MVFCITLVCDKCGRRAPYFRSTDPSIPEWVDTLSQSHCDAPGCDTGDRHTETWLDGEGVARDSRQRGTADRDGATTRHILSVQAEPLSSNPPPKEGEKP